MKTLKTVAVLAALSLVLAACADDGPTSTTAGAPTGSLALGVTLTDTAPTAAAAVASVADADTDTTTVPQLSSLSLTFDALRLYPGPGEAFRAHFGRHGSDGAGEWVERDLEPAVTVDLMDLDSTLVDLLATLEIPAGTYRGLGLHLVEAVATTVDGQEIPAVLPADHMEYLRVMSVFTVEEGQVSGLTLTVDLDATLSASDREDGVLILRPVLGTPRCGEDPAEWRGGDDHHGDGDHDGPGDGDPDGPGGMGGGDHDGPGGMGGH